MLLSGESALVLILFRQTWVAMIETWASSRTFSHCFLVFPLAAYLIWIRRERLASLRPVPYYPGLIAVAFSGLVWLAGNVGEVRVVQEFAFIGLLISLAWTILGSTVVRLLAFPLAFMVFAVPFGVSLIGPLQDGTAWFAVHALTLTRIPAVLEDRVLSVPTGSWTVAEACSGIRYLFSSIVLGVIYASLVYRSRRRQAAFIAASFLVPILANGLRAYGIVLIAYYTNNRFARGVDHIVYGWVFFTAIQLALFAAGWPWNEISRARGSRPAGHIVSPPTSNEGWPVRRLVIASVLASAVLISIELSAERLLPSSELPKESPLLTIQVSPPWQPATMYDTSWIPNLSGANRRFLQSYSAGSRRVDLYSATYSSGSEVELVHGYNQSSDPKIWSFGKSRIETAQLSDGESIAVRKIQMESGSSLRTVWMWYWIGGECTASAARVKYLQAKARLLNKAGDAIAIAIASDEGLQDASAEESLRDFLTHASFLRH